MKKGDHVRVKATGEEGHLTVSASLGEGRWRYEAKNTDGKLIYIGSSAEGIEPV